MFSAGFAVAGPIAAHILTPGVRASPGVYLALAFLLLAFSVDLPLNVAMLTGPLARWRGGFIVLQLPVSLALSVLIPGPSAERLVWIQIITLIAIILLPSFWFCMRKHEPAAEPVSVT